MCPFADFRGHEDLGRGTMKEKTKGSGNVGTEALNLSKKELLNLGEQYLKIRNYDNAMKYLSRAVLQGSSRAGTNIMDPEIWTMNSISKRMNLA